MMDWSGCSLVETKPGVQRGLAHVLPVSRDGEEAISFIQNADKDRKAPGPDLLLLHTHLPKYNSEEIFKCLSSTAFYAQISVVVMTSSDAPDWRKNMPRCFISGNHRAFDKFIQLGINRPRHTHGKKPGPSVWPGLERNGEAA